MTKRQQQLLELISQKAIDLDWNIAFGGKAKGNQHLQRVNKIAHFLQQNEGGDKFITLASAWVHDVILSEKLDNNADEVFSFTKRFLDQFEELKEDEKQKIASNVATHENGENTSIEAQIVHDADVIDKSGMLGVIRHVWKMTNMIHNRIISSDQDIDELKQHLLFRSIKVKTKTARMILASLNIAQKKIFEYKNHKQIIKKISQLAKQAVISDDIARELFSLYGRESFAKQLHNQLEVNFIKETK